MEIKLGDKVETPRFLTVRIAAILENIELAERCGFSEPTDFVRDNKNTPAPPPVYPNGEGHKDPGAEITVVDLSDKQSLSSRKGILGTFVKSIPEDIGETTPKTGKAYRIYCADTKTLSGPFFVEKIDKDKLGLSRVYTRGEYCECNSPMILNPDYDLCDINDKIIGKCCRFIEVAFEKKDSSTEPTYKHIVFKDQINLGNKYAMDQFIYENGYKKASVRKSGEGYYLFKAQPMD